MNSIFSHAEHNEAAAGEEPPATLTAEVLVPRGIDDAFAGFTDAIHLWWPVEDTKLGEGTHPEFTDGELFEEDVDGRTALWATVLPTDADGVLDLAWHLEGNPNSSSRVSLAFTPDESTTRVRLTHDQWSDGAEGQEQFAAAPDWDKVLRRYRRFMGGRA